MSSGTGRFTQAPQARSCRADAGCFQAVEVVINQCNFLSATVKPGTSREQEFQEKGSGESGEIRVFQLSEVICVFRSNLSP